jgi:hypothetical protein
MNRRGFLSLLAPAVALVIAPELLLPKRTFFLPPAGGWTTLGATDIQRMKDALARAAELEVNPPLLVPNGVIGRYVGIDFYEIRPGSVYDGPLEFRPLPPLPTYRSIT